jgi:hypothetical protein
MERRWGIGGFDWDDANEEHIAQHGVTPAEAEEVFRGRSTSNAADMAVTSFWVEAERGVIWPSLSSDGKGTSFAW